MGFPSPQPFLVPTILVLHHASGELRAASPEPIRIRTDMAMELGGRRRLRTHEPSAGWLMGAIRESLPDIEPAPTLHALLPRLSADGTLALPVWGVGRQITSESRPQVTTLRDPEHALAALGRDAFDHAFAREALAMIRRALAADPFLQRIAGDSLRMRAAATDQMQTDREPESPAVIGLLPETFSINELQQTIGAALGVSAGAMESGSNFRRRIQEFVTLGVLREMPGEGETRPGPERVGRPPRRYSFDRVAWWHWLARRSLHRKDGFADMLADQHIEFQGSRIEPPGVVQSRMAEGLEWPQDLRRRVAMSSKSLHRLAPPPNPIDPEMPSLAREAEGESRLARLEAMMQKLLARLKDRPADPKD